MSSSADSTTAQIAEVKLKVVATASGNSVTAPKLRNIPARPVMARPACALSRVLPSVASSPRDPNHSSSIGTVGSWRQNRVSVRVTPDWVTSFTNTSMIDSTNAAPNRISSAICGRW